MVLEFYDRLGYVEATADVPEPVDPVQIWGDKIYTKQPDGKFVDTPYNVIEDTHESGSGRLRLVTD